MSRLRSAVDWALSFGAYPEESEFQRGRRRLMVATIWLATLFTLPTVISDFDAGFFWSAVANVVVMAIGLSVLFALRWRPHRFVQLITTMLATVYLLLLLETTLFGGLMESGLVALFGLIIVFGALIAIGLRAALWWMVLFPLLIVYGVLVPNWVDPIHVMEDPTLDVAFNLFATGVVTFAVLTYFVRQRDSFQKQSDDLLHNILPDSVATRLKGGETLIADSFDSVSVLFADVVDFTPMSAGMSPHQLVGLLNTLFSALDGFVADLGLEKIKTVGDEYMVASGVPGKRPDHAEAVAELALRIRDHVAANEVDGHQIRLRIGINSGPVVAGVIGTNKFSYDLWGDVVNTASRMESEGVEGSIQVSQATYELIRDRFVCEARGSVAVKGIGEMDTYLLVSRRDDVAAKSR